MYVNRDGCGKWPTLRSWPFSTDKCLNVNRGGCGKWPTLRFWPSSTDICVCEQKAMASGLLLGLCPPLLSNYVYVNREGCGKWSILRSWPASTYKFCVLEQRRLWQVAYL